MCDFIDCEVYGKLTCSGVGGPIFQKPSCYRPVKWINVYDKMPEINVKVLWWCAMDRTPFTSCLTKECTADEVDADSQYWRPLPEGPSSTTK